MKIRVRRYEMLRVVNFYNEQLANIFGPIIASEARRELARIEFEKLKQVIKRQEITEIWKVPLILNFFEDGTYRVDIENEQDILIID
jgi:hypothetical protein